MAQCQRLDCPAATRARAGASEPAHQLAQALLSLLPDPPIAERACLPPTQAQAVIAAVGPQYLPELATERERGRRFVLGALRDWLTAHLAEALPLRAIARQRSHR